MTPSLPSAVTRRTFLRSLALGAAAFVAKPVTSEALLPILKEYGLYA